MTFPFNEETAKLALQVAGAELDVLEELMERYTVSVQSQGEEAADDAGVMVVECINMIYQKLVNEAKVSEEEAELYTQYLILEGMKKAMP